ncbi:MAG: ABC transporter permease [Bryobacteraceae bacterium]
MNFEWFVSLRYLTAKRKQAAISFITLLSVAGVAFGVMALVIAMAITNGFRTTLEQKFLGATPHIMILEKEPSTGIENWKELTARLASIKGVRAASPSLYDNVMLNGPKQAMVCVMKGILPPAESPLPEPLRVLKKGSLKDWAMVGSSFPLVLGARLAETVGANVGDEVKILTRYGDGTPTGPRAVEYPFSVVGIFESGFGDVDEKLAFSSLDAVQRIMGLKEQNVVNAVEMSVNNIYEAPAIAKAAEEMVKPKLAASHWVEQNKQYFTALDTEKKVTAIVIGLIQVVAVLNIVVSLIMMVMEKQRDIALLMTMGSRRSQILRVFILQGLTIGAVGAAIGLVAGHLICYFGDRGRWIEIDQSVYMLNYVPFEPHLLDSGWILLVALAASLLATLYPARAATKISPAQALRYW